MTAPRDSAPPKAARLSVSPDAREPVALATLSVVAIVPWLLFHLWEQWSALAGRSEWLARMNGTSTGVMRLLEGIFGVLLPIALAVLTARAIVRGGALPGHAVDDDDGALVRGLARTSKPALVTTLVFLIIHVGWLWAPRAIGRVSLAEVYEALRIAAGTPGLLLVHAIGLSAVGLHVAASIPAWLVATRRVTTRATRRSAALVSSGLALSLLVLLTQLYGWHATGTGTVWPIRVVEVDDSPADVPLD